MNSLTTVRNAQKRNSNIRSRRDTRAYLVHQYKDTGHKRSEHVGNQKQKTVRVSALDGQGPVDTKGRKGVWCPKYCLAVGDDACSDFVDLGFAKDAGFNEGRQCVGHLRSDPYVYVVAVNYVA